MTQLHWCDLTPAQQEEFGLRTAAIETGRLDTLLSAMTADRDLWQRRALALLDIATAVEDLQLGYISRDGDGVTVLASRYDALLATFGAWRAFTERGVPADWVLAGEDGGPGVVVADGDYDEEIDF